MSNLNYIAPFFIVEDLNRSIGFYTGKLGFTLLFSGPDDNPFWAMVGRDNVMIMLKVIADDIKPAPNHTRHPWARWDAYIGTADPAALFGEFTASGVNFHQPLRVDGDGLLGFELQDADGYMLFFGRPDM